MHGVQEHSVGPSAFEHCRQRGLDVLPSPTERDRKSPKQQGAAIVCSFSQNRQAAKCLDHAIYCKRAHRLKMRRRHNKSLASSASCHSSFRTPAGRWSARALPLLPDPLGRTHSRQPATDRTACVRDDLASVGRTSRAGGTSSPLDGAARHSFVWVP